MPSLVYGKKRQVVFRSYEEFFEVLGFLAASNHTDIHIEHNEEQGAWGSESRIHCYGEKNIFPLPLRNAATSGTGSIDFRVNCNEYVSILINDFGFHEGVDQDAAQIESNVPQKYRKDFERGLQL